MKIFDKIKIWATLLAVVAALLWVTSCSSQDESAFAAKSGDAIVNISVGKSALKSRAAFADEEPVTIYVYKRNEDGTPNYASLYKTVTGTNLGAGHQRSFARNPDEFNGFHGGVGQQLRLRAGGEPANHGGGE